MNIIAKATSLTVAGLLAATSAQGAISIGTLDDNIPSIVYDRANGSLVLRTDSVSVFGIDVGLEIFNFDNVSFNEDAANLDVPLSAVGSWQYHTEDLPHELYDGFQIGFNGFLEDGLSADMLTEYLSFTYRDTPSLERPDEDPLFPPFPSAVLEDPAGDLVGNLVIVDSSPPPPLPPNSNPIAQAGGPYVLAADEAFVMLDGSDSSDPDAGDTIFLYHWDFDGDGVSDFSTPAAQMGVGRDIIFGPQTTIVEPTSGTESFDISLRVESQSLGAETTQFSEYALTTLQVEAVPEPSSLALLGLGGLLLARRRG